MDPAAFNRERVPSSRGSAYRDDEVNSGDSSAISSIHACLASLLLNDRFSDMSIHCGGREFPAHRAIVCTQSPFFDRALNRDFKEATSRVVELPEDDPDILTKFLEFLYTGTYTDGVVPTLGKPSDVAMMPARQVQDNLRGPPGIGWSAPEPRLSRVGIEEGVGSGGEDVCMEDEPSEETHDDAYIDIPGEAEDELPEEYAEFDDTGSGKSTESETERYQSTRSNIRDDLFIPLRLYIMADKFDVPALRLLARDRFYRAAEANWEQCGFFPEVVDELYCCTAPTDTAMREIVCRLVGNRIRKNEIRDEMRHVMVKHGEFAVSVMEYMMYHDKVEWE